MNGFQSIVCVLLAGAVVRDWLPMRAGASWAVRLTRTCVWGLAIVAIANPDWVTRVANLVGIGRGADIVLYLLALAFIATTFFFYAQQLRLRRELSKVVGHIARNEPQFGGNTPARPRQPPSRSVMS
jgi:hypothetical protein